MFTTYKHRKLRTRSRFVIVEARPYEPGEDLRGVDLRGATPQPGDMIVRQRDEHAQIWLVAGPEFAQTFEVMP
jgi:hypothetical protein